MSQISPPIRILLVLAVAVMSVYMFFLRPKPVEVPPVDSAGTQPVQVESTPEAVDAAAAAATKETPAAKGQGAAAAEPAEDLKGMPKSIRKAIRQDKVLVVLFSNGKSYDDKAVEKALAKINRWDGRVSVHTAPLRKISKYGRIARGVSVEQSPTVVVADRDLRAETLVGYVDRATIDQAVVDARRNAEGIYVDSYLKAVDKVCFAHSNRWDSIPYQYPVASRRKVDREFAEAAVVYGSFLADFKAVDAPKKWQAFHAATVKDLTAVNGEIQHLSSVITPTGNRTVMVDAARSSLRVLVPTETRMNKRFANENLPRCGNQF